jgi:hypothetical protein
VAYGDQGFIYKASGKQIKGLIFIMLEYVKGGLLFDMC